MSLAPRAQSLAMTRLSCTPGPEMLATGAYHGHRIVSRTTSSVCCLISFIWHIYIYTLTCRHPWGFRTRIEMKEGKDLVLQGEKGRQTSVFLLVLRQAGHIFYYPHYIAQLEFPSLHGRTQTIHSSARCGGKCLTLSISVTKHSLPTSVL